MKIKCQTCGSEFIDKNAEIFEAKRIWCDKCIDKKWKEKKEKTK